MTRALLAAATAAVVAASAKWLSIESFGAIPFNNSTEAALTNGVAIFNAFAAANVGFNNTRTVWVPPNRNYTVLPHAPLLNLQDVTLRIDGVLQADVADRNIWPNNTAFSLDSTALDLLSFGNSSGITITGSGVVDGDGYDWWWQCLLGGPDNRPNLVGARGVSGIVINGSLLFRNSPSFHFYLYDVLDVEIHGITIWVDVDEQKEMLSKTGRLTTGSKWSADGLTPPVIDDATAQRLLALAHQYDIAPPSQDDAEGLAELLGLLPAGLPVFPLNTDGIDIAGRNVHVYNVTVENFDDALCVKPLSGRSGVLAGPCSQDYVWEDSTVILGVGLTIGSVPPDDETNCVRNITYRRITQTSPIKGIYVKPNPGNNGDGIIDSVTYEDITMTGALWWSIYVGTQQQDQPGGGADTGCSFFYPLPNTTCPPQPRVPVTNLQLTNVISTDALLSPGLLTCANYTAGQPWSACTGWTFENVQMTSVTNWPVGPTYFCQGVYNGTWANGTSPVPNCVG